MYKYTKSKIPIYHKTREEKAMNIGELVLDVLVQEGKTQSWLANRLKLSKTTLNNKLKNNTLRAEEFIKIDIILDLNYEKIKEEIKKDVDTNLKI